MNSLIILADLGRVKAYQITRDEYSSQQSPAFDDVLDVDLENQHSRVSDRNSDKAGCFSHGAGSKSVGESHHEQEHAETQQLQEIAKAIDEAAGQSDSTIFFAAPKPIMNHLLDEIDPQVRRRIRAELPLNLVKSPKLKLLERFCIQ